MANFLLLKTLVVIVVAFVAVLLVTRVRLPAVLGYLIAGVAIGPHGVDLFAASHGTAFLAELGIIFLMFMVGLQTSLPAMIDARSDVFGAGSLQVGLTVLVVGGATLALGAGLPAAILMGGVIAMSSTAITLKQLSDDDEVTTPHGRLAVGVLLFQDLAAVAMLVALDAWGAGGSSGAPRIVSHLAIAAAALLAAALIFRPVFRVALTAVARTKSPDLFLLSVLILALGTAFVLRCAGLSPPIGAFLAGLVISESDFRHQIEDDIRAFRDILVGLFFVTVGMEVDLFSITRRPLAVLLWTVALLPGKAAIGLLVGTILRWPAAMSVRVALTLAHGGEFGLLLLTQAMPVGIVEGPLGQPALLALAISMGLGPILIQRSEAIARRFAPTGEMPAPATGAGASTGGSSDLEDHVILGGCGRVGRLVATVLAAAEIPHVIVELDLARALAARAEGHRVVCGDAGHRRVLDDAGLTRARLVVITFSHRGAVERVLHHARDDNPILPSLVSVDDEGDLAALAAAGAGTVFPEHISAGLALADQVLLLCGIPQEGAARIITAVRAELHPELGGRVGI